jgi:diacylglycerol kinase family enzyme
VNGHLFFNVASIGFSAELAGELTEHAKKRWGTLGYAIVAARILMRSRLFTAFVDHDGMVERSAPCRCRSATAGTMAAA